MKMLRFVLFAALALIALLAALGVFSVTYILNRPLPQTDGTLTVPGLNNTVEVIRDEYGVPHIYASNPHDLFFAQGYVQAQDRWWQMEFSRHAASGRIQELTGANEDLLGTDIFLRTLGLRQAAQRDLDALSPDVRAQLDAFVAGVNAYLVDRAPGQLAIEYPILGLTGLNLSVEPWSALDTLAFSKLIAWELSPNRGRERDRLALQTVLSAEMIDVLLPSFPFGQRPTILEADELPQLSATAAPDTVADAYAVEPFVASVAGSYAGDGFLLSTVDGVGSNSWSVSGEWTASGEALLANDPHLGAQMPDIWYEIGLYCQPVTDDCPYRVRGYAFAPLPAVLYGHNERIAWGITSTNWDVQDQYALAINPDNPLQYRHDGAWRDMTVREETIRAAGTDEFVLIQVRETHHGPILSDNALVDGVVQGYADNPLALAWIGHETNENLRAGLQLNAAQNWQEFREALRHWHSAGQNFHYADVDGNIGVQLAGMVPARAAGHSGLVPVDGSTSATDWRGMIPYDELPYSYNPARGYTASANQAPVPPEYRAHLREALADDFGAVDGRLGIDVAMGWRAQRLETLLNDLAPHTVDTFAQMQADNKLLVLEELAPYYAALALADDAAALRDWMLDWDYQLHMDSPQAALFMSVYLVLIRETYLDEIGDLIDIDGYNSMMQATAQLVTQPDHAWWDDVRTADMTETRDDILQRAFTMGADEVRERLGDDRAAWRWGDLHTLTLVNNPLGASGIALLENFVNLGPVAISGGAATLNATRWAGYDDPTVRTVPASRAIMTPADWSQSRSMYMTGASGHPLSEHYSDRLEAWRQVEYVPMLFDRAAVEASATGTLILQPSGE